MRDKLVSIITATYNMGEYLVKAIESVQAQTYPYYEHIIIDDGSQDNTRQLISKFLLDKRIRYSFQENQGQTVAKNNGLKKSRGEYIAFLDADNLWVPEKLAVQVSEFAKCGPKIGVLSADIQLIDGHGNLIPTPIMKKNSGKIYSKLINENSVNFNTSIVRRNVLNEIGYFDEALTMGIDYDLWLRISTKYEFISMPLILAMYRKWSGQMSHKTIERMENAQKIMTKFFANNPGLLSKKEINRAWGISYTRRARHYMELSKKRKALNDLFVAMRYSPLNLITWKSFIKLMVS